MALTFFALPATAGNGPGTPVDVSTLGAEKTIVVEGNGATFEPFVLIEVSNDAAGVNWSPLVMLNLPGERTELVACRWMRATVKNYRGGGAPTVNVGADNLGASFATLVATASNGEGAGVDVSALPAFKTIQVTGTYRGSLNVEISNDGGASYSLLTAFPPNQGGISSISAVADFMRVTRSGIVSNQPGMPVITVAAADIVGGGGGGDVDLTMAALTYRPGSGLSGPSVFDSFEDLYAKLVELRTAAQDGGEFEVIFDDADETPLVIPAGAYDMTRTRWSGVRWWRNPSIVSAGYQVAVQCDDDVDITHLSQVLGLALENTNASGPSITVGAQEALSIEGTTLSASSSYLVHLEGANATLRMSADSVAGEASLGGAVDGGFRIVMDGARSTVDEDALATASTMTITQGTSSSRVLPQSTGAVAQTLVAASGFYDDGDPNTKLTAAEGVICVSDNGTTYRNTDGATTWVALAGGASVVSGSFTWRPGSGLNGPSAYDSFDDLYAALDAARTAANGVGEWEVIFDSSLAATTFNPGMTYDMTNTSWRGFRGPYSNSSQEIVVGLPDGTTFSHLLAITGVALSNAGGIDPSFIVGPGEAISLESVRVDASSEMFAFTGPGDMSLQVGNQVDLGQQSIVITGAGNLLVSVNGGGSSVQSGAFRLNDGTDSVGVSLFNSGSELGPQLPPPANTGYTQATAVRLWPLDDGEIHVGGADADINEIVLVDGGSDGAVALPTITPSHHGKLVVVKEAAGNSNGACYIEATGTSGGIDGADAIAINTALDAVVLLADQVNDTYHIIAQKRCPVRGELVGSTGAIANVETVVVSCLIPANTFKVGTVLRIAAGALRAGANNVAPTIRVRIGPNTLTGAIVLSEAGLATASTGNLWFEGSVTITALGAAGTANSRGLGAMNTSATATINHVSRANAVVIDTTVDNRIELTIISGNAGNTYTFDTAEILVYDR
jgi:hypothetical protein